MIINMWDVKNYISHRGNSVRLLFVFVLTMLMAFLSSIVLTAQSVNAAPADATWSGQSISYDGKTFTGPITATANDSHGIAPDSKLYVAVDPVPAGNPTTQQKAYVIYFAPGTSPPAETKATYVTYNYTPPSTYSNPSASNTIAVTPVSTSPSATTTGSSCVVDGIGWIVCPVTNFLAKSMDWLFDVLTSFLEVRPVQTNQQTPIYRAWSVMQSFANVAFVIAFLVIIYSQVTGGMMTNYGIKKLLPRVIAAAILVNISYWICSVAVDISNIIGYSIQDIFIAIRNNLVGPGGNGWDIASWESITGAVLSGGAVAAAGALALNSAIVATGGGFAAAIYLLLPALAVVILAAVVAVLILAARQAIITILIIISPLAFVAFLLPNTEKLFDKWKDLFTTLLVMFPMFSIVFGGAQLAGTAIIQNADSIVLIILGMLVQVAPVVITPLLIRLSGSLLGKIAGIVNNPKKGVLDRTRNFSKERADHHKARSLATPATRNAFRASAQRKHAKHMRREQWKKAYEADAEAHGMGDKGYQDASHRLAEAGMAKDTAQAVIDKAFNDMRVSSARVRVGDTNLRIAKLDVDVSKAKADVQWENLRSSVSDKNKNITPEHLATQALSARRLTEQSQVQNRRLHEAQHMQQTDFASALQASEALRTEAGGISKEGADSALASAITTERKAYNDSVGEAAQIMKHFNLSASELQSHALGGEITKVKNGNTYKFASDSIFTREAAIEERFQTGTYDDIEKIIIKSGSDLSDYKTTIAAAINENKSGSKGIFLGGQTIDIVGQGGIASEADLMREVTRTIGKGKITTDDLANNDEKAIARLIQAARARDFTGVEPSVVAGFDDSVARLKATATMLLSPDHPELRAKLKPNARVRVQEIIDTL